MSAESDSLERRLRRWMRRRNIWLTIAAAVAALWLGSAFVGFAWASPGGTWSGGVSTGVIGAARVQPSPSAAPPVRGFYNTADGSLRWLPRFHRTPTRTGGYAPLWIFVALAGAAWLSAAQNAKRIKRTLAAAGHASGSEPPRGAKAGADRPASGLGAVLAGAKALFTTELVGGPRKQAR